MRILFPSEDFSPGRLDPAFALEREAADRAGFETAVLGSRMEAGLALYRGWMLTPTEYAALHTDLASRGVTLLTTPLAYRTAHYLPETYPYLEGSTPESLWFDASRIAADRPGIAAELARVFGSSPLVIKDYVKSEKAYWHEAMFIPSASDAVSVWRVVDRFLAIRGPHLNEGVVFRRYLDLSSDALETRVFWLDGEPVFSQPEGPGAYYCEKRFRDLARVIPSRFFTMDLALASTGQWLVVECGDGQVSSVSPGNEPAFYVALHSAFTPV